jgi:aerobic-type carbon monoxide dehydrogenase small subunit (CoxS/CutS family)
VGGDAPARTSGKETPIAPVELVVNGTPVSVDGDTYPHLLGALREGLGIRSVKDGCSPQGQCGCCTVLVDGQPRVACVTPLARVAGRGVETADGLPEAERDRFAAGFVACGASQCGFCTPGIVCRLAGAGRKGADLGDRAVVDRALAAHLCRCTGWQTIVEAAALVARPDAGAPRAGPQRDAAAASRRAGLEGGTEQESGPAAVLGRFPFADDAAPAGALVALRGPGGWVVAETVEAARRAAGSPPGRRGTLPVEPPIEAPPGDWNVVLRTSWVDPGYLELDASWCEPGGEPASPLANGGAFGGKATSEVQAAARALAEEHGRAVRVLLRREDVAARAPKRPPVAGGFRADGTGVMRVARTPGIAAAVAAVAPGVVVEEVDVAGPPTSANLRAAGWAEALVGLAGARAAVHGSGPSVEVVAPSGGLARVTVAGDGGYDVEVDAGAPLDEVVLRSYAIGAAHMGLSWARSEGLAVDGDGVVRDLTVRSLGVLRAAETPPIRVTLVPSSSQPVNGSDAVFAASAAATWIAAGLPPAWPVAGRQ